MTIFNTSIIALALLSAWYDSGRINNDLPIVHVPRWLVRSALAVIAAWVTGEWILLLGSWGLFNLFFRPCLNQWRVPKRSVWYIAPWSNVYDRTIWSITFFGYEPITWSLYLQGYLSGAPGYVSDVHRAGKLAYIVELAAFGMAVSFRFAH